jgi:hypothetical protein
MERRVFTSNFTALFARTLAVCYVAKEELFMVIFLTWCGDKGISYEEIESYLALVSIEWPNIKGIKTPNKPLWLRIALIVK